MTCNPLSPQDFINGCLLLICREREIELLEFDARLCLLARPSSPPLLSIVISVTLVGSGTITAVPANCLPVSVTHLCAPPFGAIVVSLGAFVFIGLISLIT